MNISDPTSGFSALILSENIASHYTDLSFVLLCLAAGNRKLCNLYKLNCAKNHCHRTELIITLRDPAQQYYQHVGVRGRNCKVGTLLNSAVKLIFATHVILSSSFSCGFFLIFFFCGKKNYVEVWGFFFVYCKSPSVLLSQLNHLNRRIKQMI